MNRQLRRAAKHNKPRKVYKQQVGLGIIEDTLHQAIVAPTEEIDKLGTLLPAYAALSDLVDGCLTHEAFILLNEYVVLGYFLQEEMQQHAANVETYNLIVSGEHFFSDALLALQQVSEGRDTQYRCTQAQHNQLGAAYSWLSELIGVAARGQLVTAIRKCQQEVDKNLRNGRERLPSSLPLAKLKQRFTEATGV